MKSFKIAKDIALNHFPKWLSDYRIICIAILLLFLSHYLTAEMRDFSVDTGYKIAPYYFPLMLNQWYVRILLIFPIVLIFCDAPFVENSQDFIIIRSGKKIWCLGQIMYVFITSFIYTAFILITPIITNLPYINFTEDGWGKVFNTFSYTNVVQYYKLKFGLSSRILDNFSPEQAMFYSFILFFTATIFLGMLIFALNIISNNKILGLTVASIFILLDISISADMSFLLWISPVSWSDLGDIAITESWLPNISYILIANVILISIFCFISVKSISNSNILSSK